METPPKVFAVRSAEERQAEEASIRAALQKYMPTASSSQPSTATKPKQLSAEAKKKKRKAQNKLVRKTAKLGN